MALVRAIYDSAASRAKPVSAGRRLMSRVATQRHATGRWCAVARAACRRRSAATGSSSPHHELGERAATRRRRCPDRSRRPDRSALPRASRSRILRSSSIANRSGRMCELNEPRCSSITWWMSRPNTCRAKSRCTRIQRSAVGEITLAQPFDATARRPSSSSARARCSTGSPRSRAWSARCGNRWRARNARTARRFSSVSPSCRIRIAEPAPVAVRASRRRHQQLEHGLVAQDLALEILDAVLREIEVRVGVIGRADGRPSTQTCSARAPSGLRSSLSALMKPYDGGMRCFFSTLSVSRAISDCCHARRQRAVERQVVEGQRDLERRPRSAARRTPQPARRASSGHAGDDPSCA